MSTVTAGCLRALYMGDNDLTAFPPHIEKFVHLEVVSCMNGTLLVPRTWSHTRTHHLYPRSLGPRPKQPQRRLLPVSCVGKEGLEIWPGVTWIFGMLTIHLLVTSFPLSFIKKLSPRCNCLFLYEHLLLRGFTSLWHYILASFAEEIPDCQNRQILHSNSKST